MASVKEDLKNARTYLRQAYDNLKNARTHCDGVVDVDGIHYHDITKIIDQVDTVERICHLALERLERGISASKEK